MLNARHHQFGFEPRGRPNSLVASRARSRPSYGSDRGSAPSNFSFFLWWKQIIAAHAKGCIPSVSGVVRDHNTPIAGVHGAMHAVQRVAL